MDELLMSSELVLAGGTILGVVITALTTWLNSRQALAHGKQALEQSEKQQQQELMREKLEELYVVVGEWGASAKSNYLPFVRVMEGGLDYNLALDIQIDNGLRADSRFSSSRMKMLSNFYFSEHTNRFETMLESSGQCSLIIRDYKQHYLSGEADSPKHRKSLVAALSNLDKCIELYLGEVKDHVAKQFTS